ncbi:hypothetical protein ACTNCH_07380 [Candidatus Merdisoma sp. HCP28S3_D10]|uniref:hypothetical protein n=1 Tax=unclassified Candidatus Merdisoma TaxID=3099611 RepID=UPI003F89F4EA
MQGKEIWTGNFITILYIFMSVLWTLHSISKGVWLDAGIGIFMTVFGLAGLLFCKDKRNWLVDTVVVLGIIAFIVKYFVL